MRFLLRLVMSKSYFLASSCNDEIYQAVAWTHKRALLQFKKAGFVQIDKRTFVSEAKDFYKLYSKFDGFLELLQDMPKEGYNRNMSTKFI